MCSVYVQSVYAALKWGNKESILDYSTIHCSSQSEQGVYSSQSQNRGKRPAGDRGVTVSVVVGVGYGFIDMDMAMDLVGGELESAL